MSKLINKDFSANTNPQETYSRITDIRATNNLEVIEEGDERFTSEWNSTREMYKSKYSKVNQGRSFLNNEDYDLTFPNVQFSKSKRPEVISSKNTMSPNKYHSEQKTSSSSLRRKINKKLADFRATFYFSDPNSQEIGVSGKQVSFGIKKADKNIFDDQKPSSLNRLSRKSKLRTTSINFNISPNKGSPLKTGSSNCDYSENNKELKSKLDKLKRIPNWKANISIKPLRNASINSGIHLKISRYIKYKPNEDIKPFLKNYIHKNSKNYSNKSFDCFTQQKWDKTSSEESCDIYANASDISTYIRRKKSSIPNIQERTQFEFEVNNCIPHNKSKCGLEIDFSKLIKANSQK